ncbi:hypothetical protein D3C78_1574940 [compost metagenome]
MGRLVGDDETFPIGAHLCNGVGQHFYRLGDQACAFGATFRAALEDVVGFFEHGDVAQGLVHAAVGHAVLAQAHYQDAHDQRLGFRRADAAEVDDHIAVEQHGIVDFVRNEQLAVEAIGQ